MPEKRENMDEFANRLKEDAASIQVEVSPELAVRIAASIQATECEIGSTNISRREHSFWWASSLTGLAAAALIIALLNWNAADESVEMPKEQIATVVPEYVRQLNTGFSLKIENADFTEPLEDELAKLKSDLEKARSNVRRDLKSAF